MLRGASTTTGQRAQQRQRRVRLGPTAHGMPAARHDCPVMVARSISQSAAQCQKQNGALRGTSWCVSRRYASTQPDATAPRGRVYSLRQACCMMWYGWRIAGSKTIEPGRHHGELQGAYNNQGATAAWCRRGEMRHSGGTGEAQGPHGRLGVGAEAILSKYPAEELYPSPLSLLTPQCGYNGCRAAVSADGQRSRPWAGAASADVT
jgi:hypothetical protein